jgi:hypothetical protein
VPFIDDIDSDIDDSAYKYNDTWVNLDQACNSSEKSCDEAQESFEPDLGDHQVNQKNVDSTSDIDGINNRDEEVSMQENRDVHELSQEDIEIYLENESIFATQTCSQEVRSHHVPHLGQDFDTQEAAFAFYNTYSEIAGFSAKKAGSYHYRQPGKNNEVTRYTFKCNRARKPIEEEVLQERKRKRNLKGQKNKKNMEEKQHLEETGETQPLQSPSD